MLLIKLSKVQDITNKLVDTFYFSSFAGFNKPVTSETRKELEDINNTKSTYLTSESLKKDNDTYAASGVYFRCPLLGLYYPYELNLKLM